MRVYQKVSDDQRSKMLKLLEVGFNIKTAAQQCGVKYESAKAIFRSFRLK